MTTQFLMFKNPEAPEKYFCTYSLCRVIRAGWKRRNIFGSKTHQTASGLSFSGTLVHCDVRKDNIFAVSESEVLLNDWGSACYEKEGVLREASGNILDSLIQDKEVKVRSNGDLHALARTVYRLFCQPSFEYLTNECQEFWANRSKLWLYRDF